MRPKQTYMLGWLVSYTQQKKYIFLKILYTKEQGTKGLYVQTGRLHPETSNCEKDLVVTVTRQFCRISYARRAYETAEYMNRGRIRGGRLF